jgi:hypothetical protein
VGSLQLSVLKILLITKDVKKKESQSGNLNPYNSCITIQAAATFGTWKPAMSAAHENDAAHSRNALLDLYILQTLLALSVWHQSADGGVR